MDDQDFDGFDWDSGNQTKCQKHGVTRTEIEDVFRRDPDLRPDRSGSMEKRINAVGMTQSGRAVFLVFTFRLKRGLRLIRPISARHMHKAEIDTYERTKGS